MDPGTPEQQVIASDHHEGQCRPARQKAAVTDITTTTATATTMTTTDADKTRLPQSKYLASLTSDQLLELLAYDGIHMTQRQEPVAAKQAIFQAQSWLQSCRAPGGRSFDFLAIVGTPLSQADYRSATGWLILTSRFHLCSDRLTRCRGWN